MNSKLLAFSVAPHYCPGLWVLEVMISQISLGGLSRGTPKYAVFLDFASLGEAQRGRGCAPMPHSTEVCNPWLPGEEVLCSPPLEGLVAPARPFQI